MVMTESKMEETSSDSKPRINNELGDSSPELGDSNSSEKLRDSSSTVWEDPVESGEEEEKCGVCEFMKGGGCKDTFTSWEVCVEEAKKKKEDYVTECMEVSIRLCKCMDAHSDYYQPILTAEKVIEQVNKEMEEAEKNELGPRI